MADIHATKPPTAGGAPQLSEALAQLETLVIDGLRHGFCEYAITCELGKGGKRHLVIRAGKSHKFTIPEHEVSR